MATTDPNVLYAPGAIPGNQGGLVMGDSTAGLSSPIQASGENTSAIPSTPPMVPSTWNTEQPTVYTPKSTVQTSTPAVITGDTFTNAKNEMVQSVASLMGNQQTSMATAGTTPNPTVATTASSPSGVPTSNNKAVADKAAADKVAADKAAADKAAADKVEADRQAAINDRLKNADWSHAALTEDQINKMFGTDRTGMTQNPDGTWKIDPSRTNGVFGEYSGLATPQTAEQFYQKAQVQKQLAALDTPWKDMYNNVVNGKVALPYNQDQINLIQATQQSLDGQRQILEKKLNYEEGTVQAYLAQRGLGRQSPIQAALYTQQVVAESAAKMSKYDADAAVALNTLRNAMQTDNANLMNTAYTKLHTSLTERNTELTNTANTIMKITADAKTAEVAETKDVVSQVTKLYTDLAGNAPPEVISQIDQLLNKPNPNYNDLQKAYALSAPYLKTKVTPTGIIQEYEYYKAQQAELGRPALTFDQYQTIDANRKASIAAAANSSGLTGKDYSTFVAITNAVNSNPVIRNTLAVNVQLRSAINALRTNPDNVGAQLQGLYTVIKGMDPTSAVREGELALFQNLQSELQKGETAGWKIFSPQVMTKDAALKLADTIDVLYKSNEILKNTLTAGYKAQAIGAGIAPKVNQFFDDMGNIQSEAIGQTGTTEENTPEAKADAWAALSPNNQLVYRNWLENNPNGTAEMFMADHVEEIAQ
jgi:hypothetical protein